jgi:hypothetical protein
MDVADLGALRAIEERVTGKKLKVPAPVHHSATAPFSQHALPHGSGIRQPKVLKKKKQVVSQVVKRRVSANVPPFGPQTIPPIRQQTSSARRPQFPEDRLLSLIRLQNKHFGG